MKYCAHCKRKFDVEQDACPICGAKFAEIGETEALEQETAETVSTMTITGIL